MHETNCHGALNYQNFVYNLINSNFQECFSLWCNTLYGLSIANTFRNNIVYFPHNIDFRGRVYPLPPHFNHMGNDLSRSLLVFAKGKPLGSEGLDWLKIHCVNLTGKKKKESLNARYRVILWVQKIQPYYIKRLNFNSDSLSSLKG